MVGRAQRFLRNTARDVASCPRLGDKVAVIASAVGRPLTAAVNAAAARSGRTSDALPNNLFLFRDVEVETPDGRFVCRKRTSDYTIVRTAYEAALRPEFALDAGVFIDVGAHIGKYAVMLGRRLGARGRVIAIEPDPDNFAALQRNARANGLTNVTTLKVACAGANGHATLFRDPHEPIKHSLRGGSGHGVPVDARSLDSLLDELDCPVVDLLKLDVEGVEVEVLAGAEATLKRSPRLRIILEADDERPLEFLRQRGFRLRRTAHHFGVNGWYYVAERDGD